MKALRVVLFLLLTLVPAHAQRTGTGAPDPFVLGEVSECCTGLWYSNHGYTDTTSKTFRFNAINTAVKNLVLIIAGQSNVAAESPTAYTVTNSSVIDNFNVYDGGMYVYTDPPVGSSWAYLAFGGSGSACNTLLSCGSVGGRIADIFISGDGTVPAATFNRVIVVPVAIGGTTIANWTGPISNRICAAMNRLKSRGITPSLTNTTFAILWGQGESDHGTLTATYETALTSVQATAAACGFSGRFFVNEQTWDAGAVDTNVQAAQTGIVNNTTFWAGFDADTLGAGDRQSDNTHFNDTGVALFATGISHAMHASGSPF